MTIGERIRAKREELKMSQDELAKRLGYSSRSSINKIELNQRSLTQSKIKSIADALGTTPSYIMGWDEEQPPIPLGFQPPPTTSRRPIVGSIACGQPITAEQNLDGYADVPDGIRCDFCLRCRGDSMVDAGIHDGDLVYIRSTPDVPNGQIAAVRIGEEATLKRLYWDGKTLTLMPCNPAYPPMTYTGDALASVQVEGLATGYTHRF